MTVWPILIKNWTPARRSALMVALRKAAAMACCRCRCRNGHGRGVTAE
jgi:hypothetical protein